MAHDHQHRLSQLPTYQWCGVDVESISVVVPDIPAIPDLSTYSAIPSLLGDPSGDSFPPVSPEQAYGRQESLVAIDTALIRDLGAYWHEGWPHAVPSAMIREGTRAALRLALRQLPPGFGFAVWDGWRDPQLQRELHTVAYQDGGLAPGFVSPPSLDATRPPPHATGGTLDVTLTWQSVPLNLGTRFDEFVPAATSDYFEQVGAPDGAGDADRMVRDLRRLLRCVMVTAGFVQLDCEWWHFEFGTRLWAAIKDRQPLYPAALPR